MSSAIPEGARCGRHPEVGASALCARCGDFLCASCAIPIDGASYCERCEDRAGEAFPWERRSELGIGRALVATTIGVLVRTRATFAPGFRDRSVLPALAYAIVLGWPVAWIRAAVELAWRTPERAAAERVPWIGWMSSDAGLVAQAVAMPIVVGAAIGVYSAAWWLGLVVVGVGRRKLSLVVRAVAYTQGALAPFTLVALLPDMAEVPLTVVLTVYGLVVTGRALGAITGASGWRVTGAAVVLVLALVALTFVAGMALGALAVL